MPEQIPLQPMMKTMVRQVVRLQLMEAHGRADLHLQPAKDPTPKGADAPKEGCDHVRSLC